MGKGKITLRKVEIAEFGLDDLLACTDLSPATRRELEAARAAVTSLRPTAPPAGAHTPVAWAPGIVGCSCGFRPKAPASRISTMFGAYHTHLAALGIPRHDAPVIYGYGPKRGQPW